MRGECIQATPTAYATDGTLEIDPGDNQYTSKGILDSLIELSTNTFGTANNKCESTKDITKRDVNGTIFERDLEDRGVNELLCGAQKYGQAIYNNWDIDKLGAAGWLQTAISFQKGEAQKAIIEEGILEACGGAAAALAAMFTALLPELKPLELVATEAIDGICVDAAGLSKNPSDSSS